MPNRLWRLVAYGALLAGALLLLLGLGLLLIKGEATRGVQLFLLWGGALLVTFVILEFETVTEVLRERGVRGGGNVLARSLAVAGILILVNVVIARHPWTRDLTASRVNSLSPQTTKVLHDLPGKVEVTAFYTNQASGKRQAADLLGLYARESHNFAMKVVDPDLHPDIAQRAGIERDGTTVFTRADRPPERVTAATEQEFTSALIKLTRTQKLKIYFLTGHGERGLDPGDPRGLGSARDALSRQAYAIDDLVLAGKQAVPDDATVIVIAAPKTPLQDTEIKALQDWSDKGGRLLIMGAPFQKSNLNSLLSHYGLALDQGFVIDQDRYLGQSPLYVLAARYAAHPITKDLQGQITVMPFSTAVVRQGETKATITSLWDTSNNSWEKTDPNATDPAFDSRRDKRGPFSLVQAEEIPPASGSQPGRLVVAGTADFADNEWLRIEAFFNQALFNGAINWLAGQEELIALPPRASRAVSAQLPHFDANLIFYGTFLFMPLLILVVGALVWLRRQVRI